MVSNESLDLPLHYGGNGMSGNRFGGSCDMCTMGNVERKEKEIGDRPVAQNVCGPYLQLSSKETSQGKWISVTPGKLTSREK